MIAKVKVETLIGAQPTLLLAAECPQLVNFEVPAVDLLHILIHDPVTVQANPDQKTLDRRPMSVEQPRSGP